MKSLKPPPREGTSYSLPWAQNSPVLPGLGILLETILEAEVGMLQPLQAANPYYSLHLQPANLTSPNTVSLACLCSTKSNTGCPPRPRLSFLVITVPDIPQPSLSSASPLLSCLCLQLL